MYTTCMFCKKPLGANEVLESFPVGRRLAFDAARGRLWVVCRRCQRWNLTPLEERWEAVEDCERLFRETRMRASTENIGIARHREGLDLVLHRRAAAWGVCGLALRGSVQEAVSKLWAQYRGCGGVHHRPQLAADCHTRRVRSDHLLGAIAWNRLRTIARVRVGGPRWPGGAPGCREVQDRRRSFDPAAPFQARIRLRNRSAQGQAHGTVPGRGRPPRRQCARSQTERARRFAAHGPARRAGDRVGRSPQPFSGRGGQAGAPRWDRRRVSALPPSTYQARPRNGAPRRTGAAGPGGRTMDAGTSVEGGGRDRGHRGRSSPSRGSGRVLRPVWRGRLRQVRTAQPRSRRPRSVSRYR